MRRSNIFNRGTIIAWIGALLLSACVQDGDTAQRDALSHYPQDPVAALYDNAFQDIEDYYIEPVTAGTLAIAGLQALLPQSSQITLQTDGGMVRFSKAGRILSQMPAPAASDSRGWAAVVSAGVTVARGNIPDLTDAPQARLDRAIFTGIISKLDRFTRYAMPEQATQQRAERDGFGGIGAILEDRKAGEVSASPSDQGILVKQVLPGMPAALAGILIGDRIQAFDGTTVNGLSTSQVVSHLRGPIGTTVMVSVLHPGAKAPVSISIERGLIVEPTVIAQKITDGIAVFNITEFNHDTGDTLAAAIQDARKSQGGALRGIVLDLRGDPGGLLDQAADVGSLFVDKGQIVSTRGRHPQSMQVFDANALRFLTDTPMVVIVNGGSASAAEIVAAAMQDLGRAVVVGSSSYGKGTVQVVLSLENGGELTVTWARLFPPGNYALHRHGVVPLFCTSAPPGAAKPADAAAVIKAGMASNPTPRAALDQAGWQAARDACPPNTKFEALDIQVATRLLADPALYRAALAKSRVLGEPVKQAASMPLPAP